ncbi:hypothetical protein, partial [Agromyces binzhouensis]|uniref:hypothetical protein n=1 Tax=Agromyces binzhouensis TaxID=1817495 RepID=UPI0013EAF46C
GADPGSSAPAGAWGDTTVLISGGAVVDLLTGRRFGGDADGEERGGELALAEVLATYPVALLAPAASAPDAPGSDGSAGHGEEVAR